MADFMPVIGFPGYEINREGAVRKEDGTVLTLHTSEAGKHYVTFRRGGKYRQRSVNVLLHEVFGPGAAQAAGYAEPDMNRVKVQRELARRPRSGKSLGEDAYLGPTRTCHDCGKPTSNYRCEECWFKIRGFGTDTASGYYTDLYGV